MTLLTAHPTTSTGTAAMDRFVAETAAALRRDGPDAVPRIAQLLRAAVHQPDLLHPDHRLASQDGSRPTVVHAAPDGSFSVVALVWLPGQRTSIHSPRSWCVIGVHEGAGRETTYALVPRDGPAVARPRHTHL